MEYWVSALVTWNSPVLCKVFGMEQLVLTTTSSSINSTIDKKARTKYQEKSGFEGHVLSEPLNSSSPLRRRPESTPPNSIALNPLLYPRTTNPKWSPSRWSSRVSIELQNCTAVIQQVVRVYYMPCPMCALLRVPKLLKQKTKVWGIFNCWGKNFVLLWFVC